VQSKHLIKIFDHGVTPDGKPYIVMELLEGEPLDKRLERLGRLPLQDVARMIHQVSRGLSRAHQEHIIHRDLKPENIFLTQSADDDEEVAKVLDFGIAKIRSTDQALSNSTKTGAVLGTPYYMSPEQARGLRDIDHRTDVWSLGVIVFKCVTGVLPFEGESLGRSAGEDLHGAAAGAFTRAARAFAAVRHLVCACARPRAGPPLRHRQRDGRCPGLPLGHQRAPGAHLQSFRARHAGAFAPARDHLGAPLTGPARTVPTPPVANAFTPQEVSPLQATAPAPGTPVPYAGARPNVTATDLAASAPRKVKTSSMSLIAGIVVGVLVTVVALVVLLRTNPGAGARLEAAAESPNPSQAIDKVTDKGSKGHKHREKQEQETPVAASSTAAEIPLPTLTPAQPGEPVNAQQPSATAGSASGSKSGAHRARDKEKDAGASTAPASSTTEKGSKMLPLPSSHPASTGKVDDGPGY